MRHHAKMLFWLVTQFSDPHKEGTTAWRVQKALTLTTLGYLAIQQNKQENYTISDLYNPSGTWHIMSLIIFTKIKAKKFSGWVMHPTWEHQYSRSCLINQYSRTIFYIWCCVLCIQASFEIWETKTNFKNSTVWHKRLGAMLEHSYIERGQIQLPPPCRYNASFHSVAGSPHIPFSA